MPALIEDILKLEVPVIVQIADHHMPAEDVLALSPNAIIELPTESDEELTILINNKAIGKGRAVKVGENFGVRVTYIGNAKDRVLAMGTGAKAETLPQADSAGAALAEQLTVDE